MSVRYVLMTWLADRQLQTDCAVMLRCRRTRIIAAHILYCDWLTLGALTVHLQVELRLGFHVGLALVRWYSLIENSQQYNLLPTCGQIHKTSYDNFTTKILRSLFRCLISFRIIRFQHHPTRKTSLNRFIRPLIQLYS